MDESKAKFQNKLLKFYENKDYNDIVTTSSHQEMLLSNKCDEGGKYSVWWKRVFLGPAFAVQWTINKDANRKEEVASSRNEAMTNNLVLQNSAELKHTFT